MQYIRIALMALAAGLLWGCEKGPFGDKGPSGVIVESIAAPMTSGTNAYDVELGFDYFAYQVVNPEWQQECKIANSASSSHWEAKYEQYSQAMLARAAERRLDSQSLSNVLKTLLADARSNQLAYLPFAAYSTNYKGESSWLVHLTWEAQNSGALVHIRAFAITAKGLKQVGFTTCR